MNKTTLLSLTLGTAAFIVSVSAPATTAGAISTELDGKKLFVEEHKCAQCHSVPAAGLKATAKIESMKGADLGGPIKIELAKLAAFVRKESANDKGDNHKKPFKGTDEELQAIVDWLGSLEAK